MIKASDSKLKNELQTIAKQLLALSDSLGQSSQALATIDTRERGTGSILQRKDGRYQAAYYLDGKQHFITAKDFATCENRLNEAIKGKDNYTGQSFNSWLSYWFDTYKKPYVSSSTAKGLGICISKYLLPTLSGKSLSRISSDELQRLLNSIPYPRQREVSYNILNACLRRAMELGKVKYNAIAAITKPRAKSKRGKAFTTEEQKAFITATNGSKMQSLFLCYLLTGTRRNELLSLKWADIDYNAKTITIRGTKTTAAHRKIPLTDNLQTILQNLPQDGENIFYFKSDYVDRQFQKLCKLANLSGFTVHSLRHTFATRCLESGIAAKTVQQWLGHANITMTLGTYSHIQTAFELEQAGKLKLAFNISAN